MATSCRKKCHVSVPTMSWSRLFPFSVFSGNNFYSFIMQDGVQVWFIYFEFERELRIIVVGVFKNFVYWNRFLFLFFCLLYDSSVFSWLWCYQWKSSCQSYMISPLSNQPSEIIWHLRYLLQILIVGRGGYCWSCNQKCYMWFYRAIKRQTFKQGLNFLCVFFF